jgi:hypothetical protein
MIGRKFKYKKTIFTECNNNYDRIVSDLSYSYSGDVTSVISSTGVMYSLSDIEFEPLEIVRDQKLKDLGINGN